jgi:hypothetical protein
VLVRGSRGEDKEEEVKGMRRTCRSSYTSQISTCQRSFIMSKQQAIAHSGLRQRGHASANLSSTMLVIPFRIVPSMFHGSSNFQARRLPGFGMHFLKSHPLVSILPFRRCKSAAMAAQGWGNPVAHGLYAGLSRSRPDF